MAKDLKLKFCGGVGQVTGANFLLKSKKTKILVDCGLVQGRQIGEDKNRAKFPYVPKTIDILIVTHAHIDHIGRIPKLVREGFKGVIYSTPRTMELAAPMLEDSLGVLEKEAARDGKEPLYKQKDVDDAMKLWKTIPYYKPTSLNEEFDVLFKDAGHVLGSAIVELTYKPSNKKVVFTGDLGNSPTPLLKDTDKVTDADYLIMESVYGDRNHEGVGERREVLLSTLKRVLGRGGTILIPVFSLEKTQVLLHEINEMVENDQIPDVPIYLDSPLAIKITDIYEDELKNFNEDVRKEILGGDDIFDFPGLKRVMHHQQSLKIAKDHRPKIIIAGSGMSNGGRIVNHERMYLPDKKNAVVIIGYQVAGSMGRRIQEGAKEVEIDGQKVPVRAEIISVRGYSSHKDSDHLVDFVGDLDEKIRKIFVVMGEDKSSMHLVQRLRDTYHVDAAHPEEGQEFDLE